MNQAICIDPYLNQDEYNVKNNILFFAYDKFEGITEHCFNMVVASGRYKDLMVVYDKNVESDRVYLNQLQESVKECIDISELKEVISTRYRKQPLLFHCHGFSHLRIAKKVCRPIDKILLTVHCFRHALWYAKWVAILTYLLYFRSVDLWHFLCARNREEYFWFRRFPSNTCVFPLGVEELFMEKSVKELVVNDLSGREVPYIHDTINIVYIARFESWKRHMFLLRSLRSILRDNTYLYLLGDGSYLRKTTKTANQMEIRNNVIFTGNVDRKTVHYILKHAALAVTVSPSETFGWCLLEPFCMDIPIVTTNVGIANSIIHDYYNGFILNENCNEKEFLEKIKIALKHLKNIDNSDKKSLYLWDTFGKNTARCYDGLFENGNKD